MPKKHSAHFIAAVEVVEKLQKAGHTAYFAGGWVRDLLMNHPSDDIDIATSATIEGMRAIFPKTIPVGEAFGILIIVHKSHHFEVATFRTDEEYEDGRRPLSIKLATPEEDATRRDFTVNGMFYDPLKDEIIDYVGGKKDLTAKLIRAIGDADHRFKEDRLRMIRAARYAARFSFEIEEKTAAAIREHAHLLFPSVAIERVYQELVKMAKFDVFDRAIMLLFTLRLLQTIFPSLADTSTTALEKTLLPLRDFPENAPSVLRIMHLFNAFTLEEKEGIAEYLKTSNKEKKHIADFHQLQHTLSKHSLLPSECCTLHAHPFFSLYLEIFAATLPKKERTHLLDIHAAFAQKYAAAINRIIEKKPLINANDLLKLGIQPGPFFGKLLTALEEHAINHGIESKEALFPAISQLRAALEA